MKELIEQMNKGNKRKKKLWKILVYQQIIKIQFIKNNPSKKQNKNKQQIGLVQILINLKKVFKNLIWIIFLLKLIKI